MTLEEQIQKLTAERDAALKVKCFKCDDGHTPLYCLNCARDGYHHDREWKVVVEALRKIITQYYSTEIIQIAREALAHAERLMGKEKE